MVNEEQTAEGNAAVFEEEMKLNDAFKEWQKNVDDDPSLVQKTCPNCNAVWAEKCQEE